MGKLSSDISVFFPVYRISNATAPATKSFGFG